MLRNIGNSRGPKRGEGCSINFEVDLPIARQFIHPLKFYNPQQLLDNAPFPFSEGLRIAVVAPTVCSRTTR